MFERRSVALCGCAAGVAAAGVALYWVTRGRNGVVDRCLQSYMQGVVDYVHGKLHNRMTVKTLSVISRTLKTGDGIRWNWRGGFWEVRLPCDGGYSVYLAEPAV
eukprot:4169127-Pyramimonas_sp.AAC.1